MIAFAMAMAAGRPSYRYGRFPLNGVFGVKKGSHIYF